MEYSLENEILRVTVSTRGAELTGIVDKRTGEQLLWQADPALWARHAPILFPYTGRLKDGRFTHRGVVYEGGQHGFARDLEHTLTQQTPASLTFRLEANAVTMEKFPFAFWLESRYELEGAVVRHSLAVHNDSDEDMPFGIGYHPAFVCPFDPARPTGDYVLRFDEPETPQVVETGADDGLVTGRRYVYFEGGQEIPLTDHLFDRDSICFTGLKSPGLSLVERDTGRAVRVGIAGFPYVLIWSKPGPMRFLCIEPWHSLPDARDAGGEWADKPAAATLAPGEEWRCTLPMDFSRRAGAPGQG